MKRLIIILLFLCSTISIAQENILSTTGKLNFPEKCLGVWKGTMHIYNNGILRDSVKVRFTAKKTNTTGTYIWKTEYLSEKFPVTKDYKLIIDNLKTGRYILDEGNGIKLIEYNVGNKLYSMFKVDDIHLTSCTELINNQLVFEVTSGKVIDKEEEIKNYSYSNIQRVVLTKIK